jgi:hypothetical protein
VAVLKEGRSIGEVVFIDSGNSEMSNAPKAVQEAMSGKGSLPVVALSNATGDKVYGAFGYDELKTFQFARLFKDAKKAMKEDAAAAAAPATASSGAKPADKPADKPSGGSSSEDAGAKSIATAPVEEWVSVSGSKIKARLTKVWGDQVTLTTEAGKTLQLTKYQLSKESQDKLAAYASK